MPKIESIIRCEINPASPVPELCAIISAVATHQYNLPHEQAILESVKDALDKRLAQLAQLKGSESNAEQVRKPDGDEQNK